MTGSFAVYKFYIFILDPRKTLQEQCLVLVESEIAWSRGVSRYM